VRARIKIGLQNLACSPAGDARTQEVPRFVQIGEPTGCRLRAESACRSEKPGDRRTIAAPLHKSAQRRSPIFDEIRHQSELSRRSHQEASLFEVPFNGLDHNAAKTETANATLATPNLQGPVDAVRFQQITRTINDARIRGCCPNAR
jgi:hypothetical protein